MMPPTPDKTIEADATTISSKNRAKSVNDICQQMQDRFTATDIPLSTSNKKTKTRSTSEKSSDKIPVKRKRDFNKRHPSNFLYCSDSVQRDTQADTYHLFKALQIHKCSAFCMRKRKYL